MIKGVFFDLDGVLIDSEVMQQGLTEEFLRLTGYPVPPERFHLLIGSHKSLDPWKDVFAGLPLGGLTQEGILAELRAFKKERLAAVDFGALLFPDVPPLLRALRQRGIRTACASSSNMAYIRNALSSGGVLELFDLIVTCDDFTRSKPDPEIYLHCRDHFGLAADECVVVEDSPNGIAAGKAAGMAVVARSDHHFGLDQSAADYHLDDFTALLPLLERLGAQSEAAR